MLATSCGIDMHVALVFDLALESSEIRNKLKTVGVKQEWDIISKERLHI